MAAERARRMNGTAEAYSPAGAYLRLARDRTRLAGLVGGLSAVAGAAYTLLYLALLKPDPAALATAPGLAALWVPLACGLPALATLLSAGLYNHQNGQDPERSAFERELTKGWLGWLNRLAAAAITGALAGWAVWLLCIVLVPLFPGARVPAPGLVAGSALCGGMAGAVTAYASASMDRRSLLARLAVMAGLGLLLSMLLVEDPAWWRDSLSYMGRSGPAGIVFSITMVLAGVGLCGAMLEIGTSLRSLSERELFPPRAAHLLTWLLALASLGLVGVGLFPSTAEGVSLALHKLTGNGGLLIFLGVMLALRWLAPPFGTIAHLASALIGILIITTFLLKELNLLGFVWFEVIDITLLMIWLFFFEAYSRAVLGDFNS